MKRIFSVAGPQKKEIFLFDSVRSRWKGGMACLITVGLVVYLEPDRLGEALARMRFSWIVQAALLSGMGIVVQIVKWKRLLSCRRSGVSWREALESLLVGFGLGVLSPGRLGELGRGAFAKKEERLPLTGMAVLDRATSAAVTWIAGGMAAWMLAPSWRGWIAGGLGGAAGGGFLFFWG